MAKVTVTLQVTVTCSHISGPFVSRDELADEIGEQIVTAIETEILDLGESEYEAVDVEVL